MAILQLRSDNPNFSHIIRKNPETGIVLKSIRKGNCFGWYSSGNAYNLYFKDADNEVSYQQEKDEQFEYLNTTRYNSPIFVLNALSEFFKSTIKEKQAQDKEGYINRIFINQVQVENIRYLENFRTFMKEYQLDYQEVAKKNYQIQISTKQSWYQLLNYTNALFLFLTLVSKDFLPISTDGMEKYIGCLNVVDAPFYLRYLFSRNVLTSEKKFNQYKSELEKSNHYPIDLAFGGTGKQRLAFIQKELSFQLPIVDVGCGEGAYAFPFSKKLQEKMYHAIDIDSEILKKLEWKRNERDIENLVLYSSIEDYIETQNPEEPVEVIVTEVIEHMPKTTAQRFLTKILKNIPFETMIVTTPNADFNPYYELDGFRHLDHHWEMNETEFKEFIENVTKGKYAVTFQGVGDRVNGISTTQAAIITKRGEKS